jgi:protein-S-isoprenylcysteine O-methyltransferase Ste14
LISPWAVFSFFVGGVLTLLGAYVCARWYFYWKANYKGQLLTGGPYTWVRHPFYTGFLALALGLAVLIPLFETVTLALFSIAGILFYIQREEEFLLERYGRAYRDYVRRVPWKIIPRVY